MSACPSSAPLEVRVSKPALRLAFDNVHCKLIRPWGRGSIVKTRIANERKKVYVCSSTYMIYDIKNLEGTCIDV